MTLFDRVFSGADVMLSVAEDQLSTAINDLGDDAQVRFPNTAYFLPCIYAVLAIEVKTLGDLKTALDTIKTLLGREQKLGDAFNNGLATVLMAEIIEGIRYAQNPTPYEGTHCQGHMTDAEVRALGVPLVTGEICGVAVLANPAPSVEIAVDLIRDYQRRGVYVFLLGGIIDQAVEAGLQMGVDLRIVPVSMEGWGVAHIISVVTRAAMIFGAVKAGDAGAIVDYAYHRIPAFVNAFGPLADVIVAVGAGAIALGFPVITDETKDVWAVPKSLIVQTDMTKLVDTSLEARDIKTKVTDIDIPVAFSSAFEGEIIRKSDTHADCYGAQVNAFELCLMKEPHDIEDHKIVVDGPDFQDVEPGTYMPLGIIVEVAGKNMQQDFEPVFERKIHHFLNMIEGVMHTGQRDMIRVRISKSAYDSGFRVNHTGEVLYAKLKSDFDTLIDK
jgi:acetyl-CoA synthase